MRPNGSGAPNSAALRSISEPRLAAATIFPARQVSVRTGWPVRTTLLGSPNEVQVVVVVTSFAGTVSLDGEGNGFARWDYVESPPPAQPAGRAIRRHPPTGPWCRTVRG
jgi:hypothetical protein